MEKDIKKELEEYLHYFYSRKRNIWVSCDIDFSCDHNDIYNELDDYINNEINNPTFSEALLTIIDKQNITDVECYKNADIDRRLFSKIRSNKNYHPSFETIVKLIFSLKLNRSDSKNLFSLAGYEIKSSSLKGKIIEFFISKELFDKQRLDEALVSYGLKPIFYN